MSAGSGMVVCKILDLPLPRSCLRAWDERRVSQVGSNELRVLTLIRSPTADVPVLDTVLVYGSL